MHDLNDLPGALKAWEALVEINPVAQAPGGGTGQRSDPRVKKQTEMMADLRAS